MTINRLVRFGLVVAMLLAGVAWPAAAQTSAYGRYGQKAPPRSDAGVWDGTWTYSSRDARLALWIRTVDGLPQVKLRFFSTAWPEGFETDWRGAAEYELRGAKATFAMRLDERDVNTIKGQWEWDLLREKVPRIERGTFTMYRAGDGRELVLRFDDWSRTLGSGDKQEVFTAKPVWTFWKASKRLVLWEELPF